MTFLLGFISYFMVGLILARRQYRIQLEKNGEYMPPLYRNHPVLDMLLVWPLFIAGYLLYGVGCFVNFLITYKNNVSK